MMTYLLSLISPASGKRNLDILYESGGLLAFRVSKAFIRLGRVRKSLEGKRISSESVVAMKSHE